MMFAVTTIALMAAYKAPPTLAGSSAPVGLQSGARIEADRAYWQRKNRQPPKPRIAPQVEDIDKEVLKARLRMIGVRGPKILRRPLSRRLVGSPLHDWLGGATDRCAEEYLLLAESLVQAGAVVPSLRSDEALADALGRHVASGALLQRVQELLQEQPLPCDMGHAEAALMRSHPPTVWAAFRRGVRAQLRRRRRLRYEADDGWRQSKEWLLLRHFDAGYAVQARRGSTSDLRALHVDDDAKTSVGMDPCTDHMDGADDHMDSGDTRMEV